jgi:cell division protein FtsQ
MSVKAKAEKNFRRTKPKTAKRKAKRRRISWRAARILISVVVVVYAAYRAVDLVVSASTLQVRRIVVHGNERISSGEVQEVLRNLKGTSILTADLEYYRKRLLKSPWVAEVAMRRVLPGTIEVFVRERRPMGLSRMGNQLYLVDRQGEVIDEFGPQYSQFDLPMIDGLQRAPGHNDSALDERRAELAAKVIESVAQRSSLAHRVSQIDVSDLHDAVVLLDDDAALLHVGDERFVDRLQSYVDLASTLRERVPDIDYVDLRFSPNLYVKAGSAPRKK